MDNIIPIKCPNCGNPDVEFVRYNVIKCKYDGSVSMINLSSISLEAKNKIDAGDDWMTLHEYEKAFCKYKAASEESPGEWYVWYGMIRSRSRDLTLESFDRNYTREIKDYFKKMIAFIPPSLGTAKSICAQIASYGERLDRRITATRNAMMTENQLAQDKIDSATLDKNRLNEELTKSEAELAEAKTQIEKTKKPFVSIVCKWMIFLLVSSIVCGWLQIICYGSIAASWLVFLSLLVATYIAMFVWWIFRRKKRRRLESRVVQLNHSIEEAKQRISGLEQETCQLSASKHNITLETMRKYWEEHKDAIDAATD